MEKIKEMGWNKPPPPPPFPHDSDNLKHQKYNQKEGPRIKWGWSSRRQKRTFLEKIEGVWQRCKREEIAEVAEPAQNPPRQSDPPTHPSQMSAAEPLQYPPKILPYRTISIASLWEIGLMEKWVDDFARCEELVEEIIEKVGLVTNFGSEKTKNGTQLVQGDVEKLENCEVPGSLMGGG